MVQRSVHDLASLQYQRRLVPEHVGYVAPVAGHAYGDRPDMEPSRYRPAGILAPAAVVGSQVQVENHGRATLPSRPGAFRVSPRTI